MNTTEVKEMIPNRYGSGVAGMDADLELGCKPPGLPL